jgi:hypothetical protein
MNVGFLDGRSQRARSGQVAAQPVAGVVIVGLGVVERQRYFQDRCPGRHRRGTKGSHYGPDQHQSCYLFGHFFLPSTFCYVVNPLPWASHADHSS